MPWWKSHQNHNSHTRAFSALLVHCPEQPLARSKLMLCLANHRTGYFSSLNIVWAYSEQETETGPVQRLIQRGFDNMVWTLEKNRNTCISGRKRKNSSVSNGNTPLVAVTARIRTRRRMFERQHCSKVRNKGLPFLLNPCYISKSCYGFSCNISRGLWTSLWLNYIAISSH